MALQALEIIRIGKVLYKYKPLLWVPLIYFFSGILFPLFSATYIIAPHSAFGQTMRKPFIKFICHSASYFTFLCK